MLRKHTSYNTLIISTQPISIYHNKLKVNGPNGFICFDSTPESFSMLRSCTILSIALTRFSSRLTPVMNASSDLLPVNTPLEEETSPDYDPRRFYPARVGESIHKYKIVSKLGWGTNSTVWLVKDVNRFVNCSSRLVSNNKP